MKRGKNKRTTFIKYCYAPGILGIVHLNYLDLRTNVIPFSLYRWELGSQQSSDLFCMVILRLLLLPPLAGLKWKKSLISCRTDRHFSQWPLQDRNPPPASPQESLVNPRALHPCFQRSASLAAVAIMRLHVTDAGGSLEGPGVAVLSLLLQTLGPIKFLIVKLTTKLKEKKMSGGQKWSWKPL